MINQADLAFAQANANFNAFGYLALMAALGVMLIYNNRRLLPRELPDQALAALVFVVALAIRLVTLGSESLWYDEAFTGLLVRANLWDMLAATAGDVHPPGYYLITRAICQILGSNEFGLRAGSALFSAGAAALVVILAGDHMPRRAALAAGLAASVMPGLVYYGQEARAYAMLAALGLLCVWAARRGRWIAYAAALGLMFYTHNYGLLYGWVLLLNCISDDQPTKRIAATMAAGIAYLPWLPTLWAQVTQVTGGYWIPPLLPGRAIIEPLLTVLISYRLPSWATLGALGAVIALGLAGIGWAWRYDDGEAQALAMLALAPPILAAGLSVGITPVYLPRGFILSGYALIILGAGWLAQAPQILKTGAIVALGIALAFYFSPVSNRRDDIRGAVDSLALAPGAVVYHVDEQSYILFRYYAPQALNILADYPASLSYGLSPATRAALHFEQSGPQGDYLVIATGSGRPPEQWQLTQDITPPGDPIVTLYENSTQWGRVYAAQ